LLKQLPAHCEVPGHIAIVMDGNGRWAREHGLNRLAGHLEGRKATRRVVEACARLDVRVLSLYAFSAENWTRPENEVAGLMALIEGALAEELDELIGANICFRASGRREELPDSLQRTLAEAELRTRDNTGMVLNLLINYGGRAEIADAARALARRVEAGELSPDDIDEAAVAEHLYAPQLPDPDLLLRPGGEMRVSNFLLWEIAYAEIVVLPVLWPDFAAEHLITAIKAYNERQRRFGGVP
jgi:undecaprenyl diphosphate synthase